MTTAAIGTVDELLALLEATAGFDDDEDVDMLTHGLQCAATLAQWRPADQELQVAGLVHDLGHVRCPGDPSAHDVVGARMIEPLFGPRVAWLVRHHVLAKRYLVATDPVYRQQLSPRSVETLDLEGGPLDSETVARLEAHPDLDAVLTLRRADEAAKEPSRAVPALDHWRPVLDAMRMG